MDEIAQKNITLVSTYCDEGKNFCDLKSYGEALTAFEQAVQLDPNSARAHNGRAAALIGLRQYEEALAACEQAIQLDPMHVRSYVNKAVIFHYFKRDSKALDIAEQACRIDPNFALAYTIKGRALIRLHRYEEALAVCEQAIRLDPSVTNYTYKAQALHHLKRYNEAAHASRQVLQLDPSNKNIKRYLSGLKLHRVNRIHGELWRIYYAIIMLGSGCTIAVLGFQFSPVFSAVIILLTIMAVFILFFKTFRE